MFFSFCFEKRKWEKLIFSNTNRCWNICFYRNSCRLTSIKTRSLAWNWTQNLLKATIQLLTQIESSWNYNFYWDWSSLRWEIFVNFKFKSSTQFRLKWKMSWNSHKFALVKMVRKFREKQNFAFGLFLPAHFFQWRCLNVREKKHEREISFTWHGTVYQALHVRYEFFRFLFSGKSEKILFCEAIGTQKRLVFTRTRVNWRQQVKSCTILNSHKKSRFWYGES